MKKIVLAGVLAGLVAVTGCDDKKKAAATPAPAQELATPAPQPYIPPAAPVTVTPIESSMVTPAPVVDAAPAAKPVASAASEAKSTVASTYVVKRGDSLSKIAKKVYGSASKKNIDRIKKANNLKSDVVREGQKLKIPGGTVAATSSGHTGHTGKSKKTVDGNKG